MADVETRKLADCKRILRSLFVFYAWLKYPKFNFGCIQTAIWKLRVRYTNHQLTDIITRVYSHTDKRSDHSAVTFVAIDSSHRWCFRVLGLITVDTTYQQEAQLAL